MKQFKAINRSIVGLKRQLRTAVKELNQEAAKVVTRGKYDASAALVETAKRIKDFLPEVDALRVRWRAVRTGRSDAQGGPKTPLWEYYSLLAKGLVEMGGEGMRSEVIRWMDQFGVAQLKPRDLERTPRGKLIWQRNLGRAKRAMMKEGYLESGAGAKWRLTPLGHNLVNAGGSSIQQVSDGVAEGDNPALAEQIREYVNEMLIEPARKARRAEIAVRAGDIHRDMHLDNRMPAVCAALDAQKFQDNYRVALGKRSGPRFGATASWTFNLEP